MVDTPRSLVLNATEKEEGKEASKQQAGIGLFELEITVTKNHASGLVVECYILYTNNKFHYGFANNLNRFNPWFWCLGTEAVDTFTCD